MNKFACIYSITHITNPNLMYIGSTNNFKSRCSSHKHCIKFGLDNKLYKSIRDNGGIDEWNFQILKVCSDMTTEEIRKLEQQTIDLLEPSLNTNKSYNPIDLKEQKRINSKRFRERNPKYMCEYGRNYRKKQLKLNVT